MGKVYCWVLQLLEICKGTQQVSLSPFLAGRQGLERWQVPDLALQAVFTGRKALVGLAVHQAHGRAWSAAQSSLPPCKEGIAISNFRCENTKEVL